MSKKKARTPAWTLFHETDLSRESDRGCVLVAASLLDEALASLLLAHFVDNASVHELLFGAMKPLSSFSARIELCFALGLIAADNRHDLNIIRRIRNDCAHTPQARKSAKTFEAVSGFKMASAKFRAAANDPRHVFTTVVATLMGMLKASLDA